MGESLRHRSVLTPRLPVRFLCQFRLYWNIYKAGPTYNIVFLYFYALLLRKAYLSLLAILWNSAFKWVYLSFSPLLFASLLYTAIFRASSDSHFAFLHLFFLRMVLIPVSCAMSWTSVHSSSGTLSIKSSPLNLFFTPPYNNKGCDLGHTWMV